MGSKVFFFFFWGGGGGWGSEVRVQGLGYLRFRV